MKTATYIKYMALHGKIVNVDMENANSILGALSRIEKSVTDSRLKCLMDYLLSITDLEPVSYTHLSLFSYIRSSAVLSSSLTTFSL